jgi:hypothetical protein
MRKVVSLHHALGGVDTIALSGCFDYPGNI